MNDTLQRLYSVVLDRKAHPQEGSYTCYLFDKGLDKILKKVGEESAETIIAAKNDSQSDTVGEISDLIYHLMVMMAESTSAVYWSVHSAHFIWYRQVMGRRIPPPRPR